MEPDPELDFRIRQGAVQLAIAMRPHQTLDAYQVVSDAKRIETYLRGPDAPPPVADADEIPF